MSEKDFDFVIMVLSKREKNLVQKQAEKYHNSLSGFCLNAVLEKIKEEKN